MRDYTAFKKTAIRYWERRRMFYNLALALASGPSYMLTAGVVRVGDNYGWHPYKVLVLFCLSAIGANICYSFAYALEFLFGSDAPGSRWSRSGRTLAFVGGVLLSVILALAGGRNIALLEFSYR